MKSCAGRFGALTGFGLSLVKWVAIAKVCSVYFISTVSSCYILVIYLSLALQSGVVTVTGMMSSIVYCKSSDPGNSWQFFGGPVGVLAFVEVTDYLLTCILLNVIGK